MPSPESQQYLISGEASLDDWSLALKVLGRLGIGAVAVYTDSTNTGEIQAPVIEMQAGTIPYTLDEITSRDQYLGNEHLGEFWPDYLQSAKTKGEKPNKHQALCWGINLLANPSRKEKYYFMDESQRTRYAEELGLRVVSPRSLVGFSDKYAPGAYGLWGHQEYGDSVIEVGSFIESVRRIAELPVKERPYHINASEIKFFVALADKLEAQINATTI